MEKERGLVMVGHSAILAVVLYVLMVFALGQQADVAENRSILIAALVLAYMTVFGHGLPSMEVLK